MPCPTRTTAAAFEVAITPLPASEATSPPSSWGDEPDEEPGPTPPLHLSPPGHRFTEFPTKHTFIHFPTKPPLIPHIDEGPHELQQAEQQQQQGGGRRDYARGGMPFRAASAPMYQDNGGPGGLSVSADAAREGLDEAGEGTAVRRARSCPASQYEGRLRGTVLNIGSMSHRDTPSCPNKRCYWFGTKRGCWKGKLCDHCHLCLPRGKKPKSRKQRRDKKRRAAELGGAKGTGTGPADESAGIGPESPLTEAHHHHAGLASPPPAEYPLSPPSGASLALTPPPRPQPGSRRSTTMHLPPCPLPPSRPPPHTPAAQPVCGCGCVPRPPQTAPRRSTNGPVPFVTAHRQARNLANRAEDS
ncbi:unnamed protein product [Vitrella brassicaformis CCMP3155]|uniref:C3H1-type domain-containing protein n=1 Tax=Vitrella brassicaformis (strain CCMP3155) TaxID=1169540 RepID=A0A0G4EIW1_VITBC|nr:unnamed protein product [Vitrella brassicaformis CCMP3155]|eukprot:CEL96635.1 unnamed protein product [Vitrella brassicaformis CCMP3155]